jgi:hypothetical protein
MTFSHLLPHNEPLREVSVNIAQMNLRRLRTAIQNNRISIPSQVPIFPCQSRADIQRRLVEFYFVHNWSCAELGERYCIAMERIRQLLSKWVRRAAVLGYLREIPAATVCGPDPAVRHQTVHARSLAVVTPVPLTVPPVRRAEASTIP